MLRVLGSHKRFCDGITRRDLMHIGLLAPLGLAELAQATPRSTAVAPGFGSAKRCLLLYLWGSPSQIETFDPKPDAPDNIRGSLGSIATSIPGVRVGEIFPRIAKQLHRITVLRSLTHPYPVHGTAYATSAVPSTDIPMESVPRDSRHWPFMGSVVDYLAERNESRVPPIPRNFGLPFTFGSKRGPSRSGPFGGFLGPAYDPVWSEFRALGTRKVQRDSGAPNAPKPIVADPYIGILPADRFETATLAEGLTIDRMDDRASLLQQLDQAQRQRDAQAARMSAHERHRQTALAVMTAGKLSEALDVQREPDRLREQYGMTLFGQSCLAARRVLEAGGKFVTVCWDEYGLFNTGWDTHVHAIPRLKDELGPGLDNAFATLLNDLQARGMLHDTAIIVLSEHGRTPMVQNVAGSGRDHWSRAYSAVFAGAGFGQGRVVGRTDKIGGDVAETPFSPKDVVATIFHVLGIDPAAEIHDRLGRPYPIGGSGRVRLELLA